MRSRGFEQSWKVCDGLGWWTLSPAGPNCLPKLHDVHKCAVASAGTSKLWSPSLSFLRNIVAICPIIEKHCLCSFIIEKKRHDVFARQTNRHYVFDVATKSSQ